MNIKNFSVELEFKVGDKQKKLSLNAGEIIQGYEDDDLSIICLVDDSKPTHSLKINLNAKKPLEMISAQIIHDHFYGNKEFVAKDGFDVVESVLGVFNHIMKQSCTY